MFAEKTLTVPEHVMSRQVGEETVILDLGSGTYFGLDPVGARIWQLLSGGSTVDHIVTTLMGEYDVLQEHLQQDVQSLVSDLVARGLVHVS
jgi:hypothetical protein